MSRRYAMRLVAAAALATACADSSGSPEANRGPGALSLQLSAPDDSTGALLLTIEGGVVDSVIGLDGAAVSMDGTASNTRVFVAAQALAGTLPVLIYVPDVEMAAGYRVSIEEAVHRQTLAPRDVSDLRANLAPARR